MLFHATPFSTSSYSSPVRFHLFVYSPYASSLLYYSYLSAPLRSSSSNCYLQFRPFLLFIFFASRFPCACSLITVIYLRVSTFSFVHYAFPLFHDLCQISLSSALPSLFLPCFSALPSFQQPSFTAPFLLFSFVLLTFPLPCSSLNNHVLPFSFVFLPFFSLHPPCSNCLYPICLPSPCIRSYYLSCSLRFTLSNYPVPVLTFSFVFLSPLLFARPPVALFTRSVSVLPSPALIHSSVCPRPPDSSLFPSYSNHRLVYHPFRR